MKKHFLSKIKDKSGVAIMAVMLFFMVMLVMVGALTITSQGNLNVSGVSADSAAAYYAAEAGISFVVSDFKRIIGVEDGDLTQAAFVAELNKFITNHGSTRLDLFESETTYALIKFKEPVHNLSTQTFEFTIVSTGVVGDQRRTLETLVDLEYSLGAGDRQGFAVKHALLVRNTIRAAQPNFSIRLSAEALKANPSGVPWIATTSAAPLSINFNTPTNYTGIVELVKGSSDNVTNVDSGQISRPLVVQEFTQLDFEPVRTLAGEVLSRSNNSLAPITGLTQGVNINPTSTGTYTIPGGSYYIPEVNFNSSRSVTINATQDVFIVTDRLYFQNNVSFTGTGEVKFYVRKNVTTNNTFSLLDKINSTRTVGRSDAPHLFIVYVDETSPVLTVTPGNNHYIFGSFMFYNANLNFSNNNSFGGYLMTGGESVSLSNNSEVFTALYYAPNANVTIAQNGIVRGAIIANNVTISNGTIIEYEPAFLTDFPFSVDSPIVGTASSGVQSIVFRIHRTTEQ